ncbi:uncharacterized protein [Panulirus ornatus]|uniref:uncharacterized protein n=1 Tax=Panulirus ornatus TaxID=150431 RepID=UPI003A855C8B
MAASGRGLGVVTSGQGIKGGTLSIEDLIYLLRSLRDTREDTPFSTTCPCATPTQTYSSQSIMQTRRGSLLACLTLLLALATVAAFNQDRVIYKWSPLWFNNYYRRANLYKRDGSACGRENSLCAFVSEVTEQIRAVRCCGSLQCIYTGPSYTCADPKNGSGSWRDDETYQDTGDKGIFRGHI